MFRFVPVLVLAAFLCSTVYADTIVLKNGGKLHGKIESENEGEVVINIRNMGTMTIQRRRIKEIIKEKPRRTPRPRPRPAAPSKKEKPPEPVKEPKKPAPPPTVRIPSKSAGQRMYEELLKKEFRLKIKSGLMTETLEKIAEDTGINITITQEARKYIKKKNLTVKGYEFEKELGMFLWSVVIYTSNMKLKYKPTADGILVGKKNEVCGAEAVASGDAIAWADPAGDVKGMSDSPNWKRPDLTEVRVEGRGGHLIVTLTMEDDLKWVLGQKTSKGTQKGYELAMFYLDTDNDKSTGKPVSWVRERSGFNYTINVMTGFELKDDKGNTFTQDGNISTIVGVHTVLGSYATYWLREAGASGGVTFTDPNERKETPKDRTSISANKVIAKIPYRHMKLKPGQKVRVCFIDEQESLSSDERISKDGTFTLK